MIMKAKVTLASALIVAIIATVALATLVGGVGSKLKGSIFDDYLDEMYYQVHKEFFSWVRGDATLYHFPKSLRTKLQPYYENDLYDEALFAYSKNLDKYAGQGGVPKYALSDCHKIYFPTKEMFNAVKTNTLTKSQTHWVLHELAHTEQCYNYDPDGNYKSRSKIAAKRWVKEAGLELFENPKRNIDEIHDAMPLEKEAEAKADRIIEDLY